MAGIKNADGKSVLLKMAAAIQENKAYLSEVDGLIGDGDHGVNMNKGFTMFAERIQDDTLTFTEGLDTLGTLLFTEIGGSMGPIYGTLFMDMAGAGGDSDVIDTGTLAAMLRAGLDGLYDVVEARPGDKTLVDTLVPALEALEDAKDKGMDFTAALECMKAAAAEGRDATVDMVAKYGRSSRLGERSRGVLDAGAASCCILLTAMAEGMQVLAEN
ncbi:MAG: dihydroxyacetone kinase subunit L [Oscillospiraceae bacterium]|jgi:dihydroxyacetone kinase-like protein|nr:dihydroxyacetone kinase subunit L [Oscillospiraceae bacterium]